MEQIRGKRDMLGLRGINRERAFDGYTLFTPSGAGFVEYLINLDGEVVHQWQLPYSPGLYGYLNQDKHLILNGRILEENTRFLSEQPWKSGAITALDWQGNQLWEVRHPDHHHDGQLLRNGNVILLCIAALPDEIASQVVGGQPGTEADGKIYADYLVEMTLDGEVVWEWYSWEHLDPATHPITAVQDLRHEWTHGNTVSETPDGNLILSFRNISTICLVNRQTGNIDWELGAPPLAQQHAPHLLENGNILLFDNGTHRLDHPMPHSRVIEVDMATKEIVWQYGEHHPFDFFSPYISGAQRLPNGNTLICEGSFGRFFEVTPEKELVWEYVNPYFVAPAVPANSPVANRVFRAYRYPREWFDD